MDAIAGESARGRVNFVIPNESVWVSFNSSSFNSSSFNSSSFNSASSDSTNHDFANCNFRLVPCRGVDGVATRVLFSANPEPSTTWLSALKHPRALISKVRWNRTLNRIRL